MAMPAQHTEWTVDMVRALPDDGNRYEVIDGELFVTPAPSVAHQRAVRRARVHRAAPYVRHTALVRHSSRRPTSSCTVRASSCSPTSSSCRS